MSNRLLGSKVMANAHLQQEGADWLKKCPGDQIGCECRSLGVSRLTWHSGVLSLVHTRDDRQRGWFNFPPKSLECKHGIEYARIRRTFEGITLGCCCLHTYGISTNLSYLVAHQDGRFAYAILSGSGGQGVFRCSQYESRIEPLLGG